MRKYFEWTSTNVGKIYWQFHSGMLRSMRITLYKIYLELILCNCNSFPLHRPKEFIECVSHIRQLSWLLLGSLTHCALHQGSTSCMPIPLDAGSHIADHLIVILIGFPEQSKVWLKQLSDSAQILLIWSVTTSPDFSILVSISLLRHRCCTCALFSMPSCLPSCGPSIASRLLLLHHCWTRTRQNFPPVPSSLAWSSGVELRPASCSSWPTIKWWVLCPIL